MLKRIVFFIQFLFVLGMSSMIGLFLAYILSICIELTLGLKLGDTTLLVFVVFIPFFVICCLRQFTLHNTWE